MWHFMQLPAHWVARALMNLALVLADLGDALADVALRVECWA